MKLALLGGTGRIGGHVLSWALESGHDVRALARDPQSLAATRGLTVIAGDARDPSAVAAVIGGTDAVLSALGWRGSKSPDLLAVAARNITAAMTEAGIRRLICVSSAGAFIRGDPDSGRLVKAILPRIFAGEYADTRQMEAVIRASDLDWTLVRATRLVNTARTGQYRVRADYPPVGGGKISRADVVDFMGRALSEDDWIHGAPALAY